ncbi:Zn-dependent peptidase ImmA (M78 family) [Bradyrhizobium sp. USDA 4516]
MRSEWECDQHAPHPDVEKFCNAVAAAALMPSDWLLRETLLVQKGTQKSWRDDELEALALRFGVSQEVVLRRLLTLGCTTQAFYGSKRVDFQKRYAQLDEQKNRPRAAPSIITWCSASSAVRSLSLFSRAITIAISRCATSQVF